MTLILRLHWGVARSRGRVPPPKDAAYHTGLAQVRAGWAVHDSEYHVHVHVHVPCAMCMMSVVGLVHTSVRPWTR